LAEAARDLARVVRHLVDHPEQVRVRAHQRGRIEVLELAVAEDDMGTVIGRGGRTAHALRALLRARGDAHEASYDLRIREHGAAADRGNRERGRGYDDSRGGTSDGQGERG
jgi:predicted RNA-binding protein YlqC (UPF0109 family)